MRVLLTLFETNRLRMQQISGGLFLCVILEYSILRG